MINFQNTVLRRGANILLQDVNWTIYHKQRIGIIGQNGSGKSSLFAMILGELAPDSGGLQIPQQLKIAHVAQETHAYEKSALEFVLEGDAELQLLEQQLLEAEQQNNGDQIATIHAQLGEIDAYTAPARAGQLLSGLGFSYAEQQQSVRDFSGGWRVRLNLAKALICRSDVLLLDEPTNHLDLDAVVWLEKWLINYKGTLIIISHDRDFLDQVVDHIANLHNHELKVYAGNYSVFEKLRAEHLLLQQAAYQKQQKQVAHMQDFINRFKAKASKARQAQSRMKAIERMDMLTAVHADSPFQFHFKKSNKCLNPLISLEEAGVQYGEKIVLQHLNLQLAPKDRIAIVGPNGAGKSSLIKLLAGEHNASTGSCLKSSGLQIGYFAQHQVDHLRLDETPLEHFRKLAPTAKEQELRTFLGSFGFSGPRVSELVQNFSGGEKARLALALIVWEKPNLLLLDEPTNHLDLEMRNAFCIALQEYDGAMILVSHDRFLIRSTVDQLMLVANGELILFDGDLDDYQKWLFDFRRQKEHPGTDKTTKEVTSKAQRRLDANQRELRRPIVQSIQKLESELSLLNKQNTTIETKLADTTLYEEENKEQLKKYVTEQTHLQKRIKETESAWLLACEQLEKLTHGR